MFFEFDYIFRGNDAVDIQSFLLLPSIYSFEPLCTLTGFYDIRRGSHVGNFIVYNFKIIHLSFFLIDMLVDS